MRELISINFEDFSNSDLMSINAGGFWDGVGVFATAVGVGIAACAVIVTAPVTATAIVVVGASALVVSGFGCAVGGAMMLGGKA